MGGGWVGGGQGGPPASHEPGSCMHGSCGPGSSGEAAVVVARGARLGVSGKAGGGQVSNDSSNSEQQLPEGSRLPCCQYHSTVERGRPPNKRALSTPHAHWTMFDRTVTSRSAPRSH